MSVRVDEHRVAAMLEVSGITPSGDPKKDLDRLFQLQKEELKSREQTIPAQFRKPGFRFIKLGSDGEWLKLPREYYWQALTLEDAKAKYAEDLEASARSLHERIRRYGEKVAQARTEEELVSCGEMPQPHKKVLAGEPTRLTNYAYNDPILIQHLRGGGNYGIINGTGPDGGLCTLDADNLSRLRELCAIDSLPDTMETGRMVDGKPRPDHRHYHFLSDLSGKFPLVDPDKDSNDPDRNLGDIRNTGGFQVVGPGSLHPSGQRYEVIEDRPLARIDGGVLLEILTPVLEKSKLDQNLEHVKDAATRARGAGVVRDDPFSKVSMADVVDISKLRVVGPELQGSHPVHGSTSGKNFRIDLAKNSWYCDRHHMGGGVAQWLAVEAGIIECKDAKKGALKGKKWFRVLKYAQEKGLIERPTKEGFGLDDFCTETKDGWKFSPSKTSKALLEKMVLTTDKGDTLRYFDGRIYRDSAVDVISDTIYSVAGDRVKKQTVSEVLDRVRVKLRRDPVMFNPRPELLGVKNGVLNCKTGEFRDYRAEDLITDEIPVTFDPEAKCPEILRFIKSITPDYDDRITLIDIIASGAYRKALYYIAFLTGRGGSGSSTYTQLLQAFYGDESTEAVPLKELLSSRFALGALENSRFSIGSEEAVGTKGTDAVKKISGGDWISSDVKNKGRTRFRAWTKLLFTTNKIPRFDDETWAFIRRFVEVLLPFRFLPNPDPEEPADKLVDPDIIEKITTESELSGLLNLVAFRLPWIIENKQIYRRSGMHEAYKEQIDSVLTFLERFCTYSSGSLVDRIPVKTLHTKFEKWCALIVGNSAEVRRFGRYVKTFCNGDESLDTRVNGEHATVYQGLSFDGKAYNSEVRELELRLQSQAEPEQSRIKPEQSRIKAGLDSDPLLSKAGLAGLDIDIRCIERGGWPLWKRIEEESYVYIGRENSRFNPATPAFDSRRPISNPAVNPANPATDSRQPITKPALSPDSDPDIVDEANPPDPDWRETLEQDEGLDIYMARLVAGFCDEQEIEA